MPDEAFLTLRPATVDDAPRLVALQADAASGWNAAAYINEMGLSWSRIQMLETVTQEAVGAMVFWVVADEIQILNIAVDGNHRRAGLGRWMLDALVRYAREGGQSRITLEVRRDNVAALALYRGFDFRTVGVRPKYYADSGVDAILMERDV